jgi:hypothetical protein
MRWINDINEDMINVYHIEFLYLLDKGEDYPERYEIVARTNSQNDYPLNRHKTEKEAKKFMDDCYSEWNAKDGE